MSVGPYPDESRTLIPKEDQLRIISFFPLGVRKYYGAQEAT